MGGALLGGALGAKATAPKAPLQAMPDVDAVRAEASRLYNDPAVKDLRIHPQAVSNLGAGVENSLLKDGFRDHPDYGGPVLDTVRSMQQANGPVAFDDLETIRKSLNKIAGDTHEGRPTTNAAAAMKAKSQLDDFIHNDMTNPTNVLQGDPVAARGVMEQARANAGAAIRSDKVSKLIDNAEIDAGAANSGMNIQNRIRQTLKPFLKNGEAKMAGFNDTERASMSNLVRGSAAMNALRYAGNAIGGSGISMLPGAYIGHAALGPAGFALPAAGWALKKTANVLTQRQARSVADKLLSRAPLSQRALSANKAVKAANDAAARHLMLGSALRTSLLGPNGQ
jgi:hypothetical protein